MRSPKLLFTPTVIATVLALGTGCVLFPEPIVGATPTEVGQCEASGFVVSIGEAHPTESCQVCGAALDFEGCLFGCDDAGQCRTPSHIAAGQDHTCALVDGNAYCWGNNAFGQVGNGRVGGIATEVQRVVLPFGAKATAVVTAPQQTCVLTTFGQVFCWGAIDWIDGVGYLGMPCADVVEPTGFPTLMTCIGNEGVALEISHHERFLCALIEGKSLFCLTLVPASPIASEQPLSKFTAGAEALCVLTADGAVHCTGLGPIVGLDPEAEDAATVTIALPEPVVKVSAGWHHACAWSEEGEAWCWGANPSGEVPSAELGTTVSPLDPAPIGLAVDTMITGRNHTCGVTTADRSTIRCWGASPQAGVSDGATAGQVQLPSEVSELTGNGSHTCALDVRGVTWCWGENTYGQLGTNYLLDSSSPKAVLRPNPTEPPQ